MSEQDEELVAQVERSLSDADREREEQAQIEWQEQRDEAMTALRAKDTQKLSYNEADNYARSHASIDPQTGEPVIKLPERPEE